MNIEGIDKFIKDLEKDTKALKEDLFRICWFMRGGIQYSESVELTPEDREIIQQIIEQNLKIANEKNIPFF